MYLTHNFLPCNGVSLRVDGGQILERSMPMAKKESKIPKDEKPTQRFKRVVEPRVGKALKAIGLVGSVSGSAYKCTPEQIAAINAALTEAVEKTVNKLSGVGDTASGFSLS